MGFFLLPTGFTHSD